MNDLPSNSTFNHEAAKENIRNKSFVKLNHGGGITTINVDSKKATYKGTPVWLLSAEQKKKFENIVLFMHLPSLKQIPIVNYV